MAELYSLDSNVYVRALRDRDRLASLKQFLLLVGTRLRINAVVALELRAGARTAGQQTALESLLSAYTTRGQVVVPSMAAYIETGRVLAALAAREGVDIGRAASLVNDTLIAASSREADVRVVTENVGDFSRIQRQLRGFRYMAADELLGA